MYHLVAEKKHEVQNCWSITCFCWSHSVSQSVFTRGPNGLISSPKKTKEPDSVQLRRECEVQHLLGVNTLKSRAVNEVPTGPLTSSKSCLASASVVRLQAGQQIPKARPTYAQEKAGPAEPVNHKLPVRLKRYINCEMQTGTL